MLDESLPIVPGRTRLKASSSRDALRNGGHCHQHSPTAAFYIRSRLVRRFGVPLADLLAFPPPERLAADSLRDPLRRMVAWLARNYRIGFHRPEARC